MRKLCASGERWREQERATEDRTSEQQKKQWRTTVEQRAKAEGRVRADQRRKLESCSPFFGLCLWCQVFL